LSILTRNFLNSAEGDMTPELDQALDAAGVDYTSEIYPGTIHGFTMSDTDAFSPSGLQRHWDRLLPLLDRALASGQGQAGGGPIYQRQAASGPTVASLHN
jgi:carboxymethylenebutenolidase